MPCQPKKNLDIQQNFNKPQLPVWPFKLGHLYSQVHRLYTKNPRFRKPPHQRILFGGKSYIYTDTLNLFPQVSSLTPQGAPKSNTPPSLTKNPSHTNISTNSQSTQSRKFAPQSAISKLEILSKPRPSPIKYFFPKKTKETSTSLSLALSTSHHSCVRF